MKYFIRSVKYFFYLLVILAIIITVLVLAGFVEADISKIFINGYDSLWQICLIMAVFAAIYPKFGFSSRTAHLYGAPEDIRPTLIRVMELHGYRLEKEDGEVAREGGRGSYHFREAFGHLPAAQDVGGQNHRGIRHSRAQARRHNQGPGQAGFRTRG